MSECLFGIFFFFFYMSLQAFYFVCLLHPCIYVSGLSGSFWWPALSATEGPFFPQSTLMKVWNNHRPVLNTQLGFRCCLSRYWSRFQKDSFPRWLSPCNVSFSGVCSVKTPCCPLYSVPAKPSKVQSRGTSSIHNHIATGSIFTGGAARIS